MMDTKKSELVALTDAELEKATGGTEQNNETESPKGAWRPGGHEWVYGGCFVWKGYAFCTMADLRDALLRGLITEEDAQIIGKNI